ncbi:MAG: D-alanyl-D-alanine carboxypeptidase/D-alanyl-D-alanine-endopeptidase [Phycisphaerae bacterium]|nr:D-alanyl-D-alanine carboxypeptidase/D-alanyl-D-alanine-endopeptidase [Phycisphaerae bacterium]|tara:strand:+ start:10 stop:1500 length:1491 start_codon:yes stop_codon:yes gene_type:complete
MPTSRHFRFPPLAILAATLLGGLSTASGSLQGDAELAVRRAGFELEDVSVCVIDAETGRRLVDINASTPRVPASNMKLLTSGVAARLLGSDFRFRTRLLRDGDRLVVVGDGDPAFGDPVLLARMQDAQGRPLDPESLVDLWVDAVVAADIDHVDELVIDDRIFDREFTHASWPREQLINWYCAEVSGLNFHTNTLYFNPKPARGTVDISRISPAYDFLEIKNQLTNNTQRSKQSFAAIRPDGTNRFTCRGNITSSMKYEATVHDMPTLFGRYLAHRLAKRGVRVGRVRLANAGDPDFQGQTLGPVVMTPLAQVLERCNSKSHNLYAEAILKRLGAHYTRSSGGWDNGGTVIRHAVQDALPRPDASLHVADGSGMSRENRLSAATLATWLADMDPDDADDQMFIESLPEPGEGTLRKRFTTRGRNLEGISIKAKSGYLNRICTLSGYVMTDDGRRLCFSILVNSPTNRPREAKAMHERIVLQLVDRIDPSRITSAGG